MLALILFNCPYERLIVIIEVTITCVIDVYYVVRSLSGMCELLWLTWPQLKGCVYSKVCVLLPLCSMLKEEGGGDEEDWEEEEEVRTIINIASAL